MKRYVLIAGVNGAGKSTLYQVLDSLFELPRINIDEIVRSFGDWRNPVDVMKAGKLADSLAYPNNTFDIVMSGHVVGDNYAAELSEIFRVVKSGGWVLDCPGEERRKREPDKELLRYGFEEFHYVGSLGGDVYRYRKQIFKAD